MADPQLTITGAELVTFDGTDGWLLPEGFYPQYPNVKSKSAAVAGQDGAEIDTTDYDNIVESVHAKLIGSTTLVRAAVQKMTRMFDAARRYNQPGALPVYVRFRPDSTEVWYRSQILVGRVVYDKDALDWMWWNGAIDVTLIFTRRYYWEADAESEISLIAKGDTPPGATGGKTITNHDDSGHGNWINIWPGQITGDARVPIRLEMTNLAAASVALIWVGREWTDTGSFITAALEGESATPLSNQADANSSNGNFNRLTWSGTTETDIATWTFAAADLTATQGRWHRVLARFANTFAYTDLYLRVKLLEGTVVIYQSEKQLMAATTSLQEIASLPLPPNYLAAGSGVKLVLQATRLAGGSMTVDLDYLQAFTLDGWRRFYPLSGSGVGVNAAVVDEGIGGYVYSLASAVKAQDWTADGQPLKLQPGPVQPQRLRFLMRRSDGTSVIADTMTVRVYFRPRRLTI